MITFRSSCNRLKNHIAIYEFTFNSGLLCICPSLPLATLETAGTVQTEWSFAHAPKNPSENH